MRILVFLPLAALAACVAPSRPAPQPVAPAPRPVPVPVPPPPPPASADWRDWPLTPGTWSYAREERGSLARFGRAGAEAELTLRCDRAGGALVLSRRGSAAAMTVRTSSTARTLVLAPSVDAPGSVAARLTPRDPILDAMGYSRGRFVIEMPSAPALVVPAWAELLRVTEDCRG